ncbi:XRE family transcriptional regulator [Mesorhizobium sp. M0701]|uniref:XRE family transcriptional regulator n=1 Tax=Mesorhizobium sp. M0701 TaxID=2956989 RepID=UPI00333572A3
MTKEDIADRLKTARINAGFRSAREAAASLAVPYQTYAAHENGHRAFDNQAAAQYARRFRISTDWLLTGRGDGPEAQPTFVPLMGYVGAGAEVEPDFEQVPPEGLDQIEVPFHLPADMIALQVKGDSMLPQFRDGVVIIVYREQRRSIESFYGEEAAVRTTDGRRYIKTILRGQDGVNLISWNAPAIENVHLAWVGEIFTFFPATAIRRVNRQGGIQGQLRLKTA